MENKTLSLNRCKGRATEPLCPPTGNYSRRWLLVQYWKFRLRCLNANLTWSPNLANSLCCLRQVVISQPQSTPPYRVVTGLHYRVVVRTKILHRKHLEHSKLYYYIIQYFFSSSVLMFRQLSFCRRRPTECCYKRELKCSLKKTLTRPKWQNISLK